MAVDGRLPIYRDTLAMIRSEPWTGVGVGQFQHAFHRYRERTIAQSQSFTYLGNPF
jgi:O-antigen ligase